MLNRKFISAIIIITLAAVVAVTTTRCYDDDKDARVTIHLERNDLAAMGIQPEKHFIDRVLEFFSTPSYAGASWSSAKDDITLTITSDNFETLTFTVPANAVVYDVIIPSGNNITFTITCEYDTFFNGIQKNWGGEKTVNLGPGEQEITIQMLPMTFINGLSGSASVLVQWLTTGIPAYITSYKIYRSTNSEGPFLYKGSGTTSYNDTAITSGQKYYYRVSTVSSYGEGVKSDTLSYTP